MTTTKHEEERTSLLEQEVANEPQWVVFADSDGEGAWVRRELAHDWAAVARWVGHNV